MLFADRYQLTLASHCGLANLTGRNSALLDQQTRLYAPVMTDMPTWVAAPSLRVDLVTAVRTRVPARPELWHLESAVRGMSNLKTFISISDSPTNTRSVVHSVAF